MLIATRLNFLYLQARVSLVPDESSRDGKWAEFKIDQGLRIFPTPDPTAAVLDALAVCRGQSNDCLRSKSFGVACTARLARPWCGSQHE